MARSVARSLGGQNDVMRQVISNGTPRMPGCITEPAQIDAIVAYSVVPPKKVRFGNE